MLNIHFDWAAFSRQAIRFRTCMPFDLVSETQANVESAVRAGGLTAVTLGSLPPPEYPRHTSSSTKKRPRRPFKLCEILQINISRLFPTKGENAQHLVKRSHEGDRPLYFLSPASGVHHTLCSTAEQQARHEPNHNSPRSGVCWGKQVRIMSQMFRRSSIAGLSSSREKINKPTTTRFSRKQISHLFLIFLVPFKIIGVRTDNGDTCVGCCFRVSSRMEKDEDESRRDSLRQRR